MRLDVETVAPAPSPCAAVGAGASAALTPALSAPALLPAAALSAPFLDAPGSAFRTEAAPAPAAAAVETAVAPARAVAVPDAAAAAPPRAALDVPRDPKSSLADLRRAVQLETVNTFWDARHLTTTRLPVVVGSLKDETTFSRLLRGNAKVQSMTIKKAGTGLRLPANLGQFREAVETAFAYEKSINPQFDRYYAYLNVAQGPVDAGVSQKRPDARADGYPRKPEEQGEIDRMYLVSDALPTEIFDQPFPIPQASQFAAAHMTFENAADPSRVVVHPPYAMTMMDSYTVHRSAKADAPTYRTFIQVRFSARPLNISRNTPNPLFDEGPPPAAFPRLADAWSGYAARYRAAENPVVADPRAFFAEAFQFGLLWWTNTLLGPRPSLQTALASGRRVAREHLEKRSPGSAAAFESFARRVLAPDNPELPYAQRKRLGHALIEASLLPAPQVPAYFDGLFGAEERRADAEFRRARQDAVLASFRTQTSALLAERAARDPRDNIAAVILTGSYAHGSAKASSDFDLLVLTKDGTGRGVPDFMAALERLRAAHDWPTWKDWQRFPDGSNIRGVDDPETARFVRGRPIVALTPDAALRSRLELAAAAGRPAWTPTLLERLYARLTGPLHRWRVRRELAGLP